MLEVASGEMRDEEGEEAELEEAGLEEEEEEDLTEEESSASLSGSSAKEKMDVRSSKSYKNVTIQVMYMYGKVGRAGRVTYDRSTF